MAEWLYEAGIGYARALLVEAGTVIEARLALESDRVSHGEIVDAHLKRRLTNGRVEAVTARGEAILLNSTPVALPEGAALWVRVTREAIREPGRLRPAQGEIAADAVAARAGATLIEKLRISGVTVREARPGGPDPLDEAGWAEIIEEARTGEIAFDGGLLHMALTPAMTLFDVDGDLKPKDLAIAGARAAGAAIRRLGISGSIGIDLPTLASKAERQAAAEALDAVLPQPFERTAVNGFGFLQVVRRRTRASLPELCQWDAPRVAAAELARRALRTPGAGARTISCHPAVERHFDARRLAAMEAKAGHRFLLRARAETPIWGGHVDAEHP